MLGKGKHAQPSKLISGRRQRLQRTAPQAPRPPQWPWAAVGQTDWAGGRPELAQGAEAPLLLAPARPQPYAGFRAPRRLEVTAVGSVAAARER